MRYVEQEIHGYTWSPQTLTDRDTIVVISYTDGEITKSVEIPITVYPAVTSLQITSPLDKLTYKTGEQIDLTGLAVTAFYTDGSSVDVTDQIVIEPLDISNLSAGTHNINIKFEDKIVSFEIIIEQDALPIPSQNGELVYNGSTQSPTWDNYNETLINISGTTSSQYAGVYQAIFSLKDSGTNSWIDGTIENKTVNWEIKKAKVLAVPRQVGTLQYSGSSQSPIWQDYDSNIMTITGSTQETNCGTYSVIFTLDDNHEWEDGTIAKQVTWVIEKGIVAAIPSQNGTLTYNGSSQTPNWLNYNATQLTIAGTTSGINAGTYKVRFAPTANYTWSDGTTNEVEVEWIINKMILSASPTQSGILTYSGSPQSPSWNNYNSNYLTITGGTTSETNAGEYQTIFTPTVNCTWANGNSNGVTCYWIIGKKKATITLSPSSVTIDSGESASISVIWDGDSAPSILSIGTDTGTLSSEDYAVVGNTYSFTGGNAGTVIRKFLIMDSDNYEQSDSNIYLTITINQVATWEWGSETASGVGNASWWQGLSEWISTATTSQLEACIGKTKSVTLSSAICGSTTHLVMCIGANIDASKTLTFQTKNCLPNCTVFAASNVGWSSSTVRNLCQQYYNYFPGKNYILSLSKGTNTTYNTSSVSYTTETVWLPSIHEMGYAVSTSDYRPVGAEFTRNVSVPYQYYTSNTARQKKQSDSSSTTAYYWTRSYVKSLADSRSAISGNGVASRYTYNNTSAVRLAPAFTIKGT